MKKMTTLVVALVVLMGSLVANPLLVKAASPADCIAPVTEVEAKEATAYDLCSHANSWAEYKVAFEDFQYERGDFKASVLKRLPENLANLTTFRACGIAIMKEEADEFEKMLNHAISLYNETEDLKVSVSRRDDDEALCAAFDIVPEDVQLTHLGNVVKCCDIPYYANVNDYLEGKGACYYQKQILCYTCGVAYWNPDGTLEKMEYIPFDEVANLTDEQKPKIDSDFEGTTLVLLCTTDAMLGWANLDGLFQYEDAKGNMEFYNPDFIKYN